jgi:ABC-type multidrug transport system fused ATPase/permease subunit
MSYGTATTTTSEREILQTVIVEIIMAVGMIAGLAKLPWIVIWLTLFVILHETVIIVVSTTVRARRYKLTWSIESMNLVFESDAGSRAA